MSGVKTARFIGTDIPVVHDSGKVTKVVKRPVTVQCLKCDKDLETVEHLMGGRWRLYSRTHKNCHKSNRRSGAGALGS